MPLQEKIEINSKVYHLLSENYLYYQQRAQHLALICCLGILDW